MGNNNHLHHRRSIRLNNYNYSQNGSYFITICTESRQNILGKIADGLMILNQYGIIVDDCISKIGTLHKNVEVNCKVVMPNHVHFIIEITDDTCHETHVGVAYHATPTMQQKSKMLLPKLIQQFKSSTVKLCKNQDTGLHNMQPLRWQRNYYEHIIRNKKSYQKIWEYINTNTLKWAMDRYYHE